MDPTLYDGRMRRSWLLLFVAFPFAACGGTSSSNDTIDPSHAADGGDDAALDSGGLAPGIDGNLPAVDAGIDASPDTGADASPGCLDLDGDGFGIGPMCLGPDCDDQNPLVNPTMAELADDGLDNDCASGDLKAAAGVGSYVDGASASCSDTAVGRGTKALPYCTLVLAVVEAYQATAAGDPVGKSIFVAKGSYPFVIGFPKSMRLYGGYDPAAWTYDPAANVTTIGGTDILEDPDGKACRLGAGCGNGCACVAWDGWLSINAAANAVVQGFTIAGGARPASPIHSVQINSSGHVELAHDVIIGGAALQNVAVQIPATANDVWILHDSISAGTPSGTGATATAYGLNNLGTARVFGSRIDGGPGRTGSYSCAVQNYGTMSLASNVLQGGDFGGGGDDSYGLINLQTGNPPSAGTAYVAHNVIFAGRGTVGSRGILSNSPLTLVNNVIGDRVPGSLTFASHPTGLAIALDVGFASTTTLLTNDLVQLVYSDEVSPPNAAANRHMLAASKAATTYYDTAVSVNGCAWNGCTKATANLAVAPGFVSTTDFHLAAGSALLDVGTPAKTVIAGGLATLDLDGDLRPKKAGWDIGADEKP
jgi:hypothetical protein